MNYDLRFEKFIEPARSKPQFWRFVLGLILMFAVWGLVALGIVSAISFVLVWFWDIDPALFATTDVLATPSGMIVALLTFAGLLFGAFAAAKVHRRGPRTLFGHGPKVIRDFLIATLIYTALGLPLIVASIIFGDSQIHLEPSTWALFLPIALALVALQTLSEEVAFRGYILQALAARFNSPFVWMVLPSLLFGSLHYNPAMPLGHALAVVGLITLFGLVAADLTAKTGSLGAAWGFHFANNVFGICILSMGDTLSGFSLFVSNLDPTLGLPLWLYPVDAALILAGWFLIGRAVQR